MQLDVVPFRNLLGSAFLAGALDFCHARCHNFCSVHHQIYGALHLFPEYILPSLPVNMCSGLRPPMRLGPSMQFFEWKVKPPSRSRTQSIVDTFWYASVCSNHLRLVLPPRKEKHFPFFRSWNMGIPIFHWRVPFHIVCWEFIGKSAGVAEAPFPDLFIALHFESFRSLQTPNTVSCWSSQQLWAWNRMREVSRNNVSPIFDNCRICKILIHSFQNSLILFVVKVCLSFRRYLEQSISFSASQDW